MYKKFVIQVNEKIQQECIVRTSDNAHISSDELHRDFREYLAWVAEGNTPEPWNPEETN